MILLSDWKGQKMTSQKRRALLRRKGIRQTVFAAQAGVSDAFLSRYLRGQIALGVTRVSHIRLQRHFAALEDET
jgi:transcriptional regulator with XRE-family HTH domain